MRYHPRVSEPVLAPAEPRAQFRCCPRCGAVLTSPGACPLVCAACGFAYYFNPAVSAAGILLRGDGQGLFIRRGHEPGLGRLAFVGGFVDAGETPEDALRREVREEVGVELDAIGYLGSQPNTYAYRGITYHVVDLIFVAQLAEGCGAARHRRRRGHRVARSAGARPGPPRLRVDDVGARGLPAAADVGALTWPRRSIARCGTPSPARRRPSPASSCSAPSTRCRGAIATAPPRPARSAGSPTPSASPTPSCGCRRRPPRSTRCSTPSSVTRASSRRRSPISAPGPARCCGRRCRAGRGSAASPSSIAIRSCSASASGCGTTPGLGPASSRPRPGPPPGLLPASAGPPPGLSPASARARPGSTCSSGRATWPRAMRRPPTSSCCPTPSAS